MSWGSHPDTIAIACAQGIANRATSEEEEWKSARWYKEYRKAYAENGCKCCYGLNEYLSEIDEKIEELEKENEKNENL
jgi:hypothetical protein